MWWGLSAAVVTVSHFYLLFSVASDISYPPPDILSTFLSLGALAICFLQLLWQLGAHGHIPAEPCFLPRPCILACCSGRPPWSPKGEVLVIWTGRVIGNLTVWGKLMFCEENLSQGEMDASWYVLLPSSFWHVLGYVSEDYCTRRTHNCPFFHIVTDSVVSLPGLTPSLPHF